MSLKKRSYEKELLDSDNIPHSDLLLNLHELNTVNTFLGGHNITCNGIDHFLNKRPSHLTIAEIGCGGGDNLFAIQKYLAKKQYKATLIGVDIKPECIAYAKASGHDIEWICSDYHTVKWSGDKPDIIFSSLFCHHFNEEELAIQMEWLKQNSKIGFFVNDLHRHVLAYYSIKIITKLFSRSYLVKNDAPLSVKRGFRKNEWIKILSSAGIKNYRVKWQWAFRYLICVNNE